jgi:hypothetical protein
MKSEQPKSESVLAVRGFRLENSGQQGWVIKTTTPTGNEQAFFLERNKSEELRELLKGSIYEMMDPKGGSPERRGEASAVAEALEIPTEDEFRALQDAANVIDANAVAFNNEVELRSPKRRIVGAGRDMAASRKHQWACRYRCLRR